MLTVKHIDTDGTETILEAERVEKVATGDNFMDGVFLDREPAMQMPDRLLDEAASQLMGGVSQSVPGRSFKHVFRFAACRTSGDRDPMIYVMNRFGATVATYHL